MSPICGNELAKSIIFEQSRVVPMLSEIRVPCDSVGLPHTARTDTAATAAHTPIIGSAHKL